MDRSVAAPAPEAERGSKGLKRNAIGYVLWSRGNPEFFRGKPETFRGTPEPVGAPTQSPAA